MHFVYQLQLEYNRKNETFLNFRYNTKFHLKEEKFSI